MSGREENQQLPGTGLIAILGAGSLGRLWAGYLSAGKVAFVPRHGSADVSGADSLSYRLQRFDGSAASVSIPWLTSSSEQPSVLLVTTKAGDTLGALESRLPELPCDTPIVLFQNGMGSQQAVAERWPRRPILAASTTEGANRPQQGQTVHAGRGETRVGALTDRARPFVKPVVQALAASGLKVHAEPDIRQRLWDKLIVNAGINAFTAILNCRNGDILNSRFYLERIDDLCAEIAAVLEAEGGRPLTPAMIRERIETVAQSTANNTSSMLSDRQKGRTTEIDFINGYVARRGQAHGIEVPVNQMLTERVQQLSADPEAGRPGNQNKPGAS
ncbi:ketopantoate reductase family protein [Marinobacter orientalis]|uniref:2-dehydropantoate 2-reductase n=1 Tax=Marinobacter orientalis TaxID=1928859 RepID=A0A7Y0WU08_9GAMM|nr:2-dehydropantoate 2-reductase [Marinobacter orientalis]NMT65367.1 2-dehydropantoate 2-reductase [Marinobacter orientalis]TGX47600.1 2-dehydropantoate 2-reductase [Marinobacter orientalis]